MKRFLAILVALAMAYALMSSLSVVQSARPYSNADLVKPASSPLQNPFVFVARGVQIPKTTARPQRVIEVHNAKEFYKALKSNVTIKLLPGDYNMEAVESSKYVTYGNLDGEEYYVSGAILRNLKNVRVFSDTNEVMYSSATSDGVMDDNVLVLSNCSNVKFENITFGHISKNPSDVLSCAAGVMALFNCKNVEIKNCDLFGCGYVGFSMEKCSSITIRNSKIRECETSAFWLYKCKKVSFYNTELFKNGMELEWYAYGLGEIKDSTDTLVSACNIHDNGSAITLSKDVFADNKGDLTVEKCTFLNNKYYISGLYY